MKRIDNNLKRMVIGDWRRIDRAAREDPHEQYLFSIRAVKKYGMLAVKNLDPQQVVRGWIVNDLLAYLD